MKFFGQLKKALLELVTGTPADSSEGRIWYDVTPNTIKYQDDAGVTEVASINRTQEFINKTLTSPIINTATISTPVKLEPKHGLYADLVTYALTATNGQLCYATDLKKAYIIVDNLLDNIGGNSLIGKHEIPTGLVNGVNDDFTIANVPIDDTILVLRNGLVVPESEITYVHPVITLSTAPSIGQLIEVYYLTEGDSATIQLDAGNEIVENRTITAGEITAKKLILTSTPSVGTKVKVDVRSSSSQIYGLDFIVSGDELIWDGYDLESQVVLGAVFRIVYFA
jgi:hypothetical protein